MNYENVKSDGFAGACQRLRDNDASLEALKFDDSILRLLIARLVQVDIKGGDVAAFVEGMRHSTHLRGLLYVPMMVDRIKLRLVAR